MGEPEAEADPFDLLLSSRNSRSAACQGFLSLPDVSSLSEETLDDLIHCVLCTVDLHNDRATRLELDRLVRKFATNLYFFDKLAAQLVERVNASTHSWAALMILGWCKQLLQARPDVLDKPAWASLSGCVVIAVDHLFAEGVGTRAQAVAVMGTLLKKARWVLEPLLACALEARSADACALICCLTAHMTAEELTPVLPEVLDVYSQVLLCAPVRPAEHSWHCFDAVLANTSSEQVENTLMPALLRGLKRAPEAVMGVVAALFASLVHTDLSAHLLMVMHTALQDEILHADADRRAAAVNTLCKLAQGCQDPAQIIVAVQNLGGLLRGSQVKLSYNYQKEGCMAGLVALSSDVVAENSAEVISLVLELVTEVLAAEKDETVRLSALGAAAQWAAVCGVLPTAAFWNKLINADKHDAVQAAAFTQLHGLMTSPESTLAFAPSAPQLLKLLSSCGKKPAERAVVLGALGCLVRILEEDPTAMDGAVKLWASVLTAESWLNSAAAIAKASPPELLLQVHLSQALLRAPELFQLCEAAQHTLGASLVRCMLSGSHTAYRAAHTAGNQLVASSSEMAALMQQSLWHVLDSESRESVEPMHAARALCAVVDVEPSFVPAAQVLLLAHHPRMQEGACSVGWRMLSLRLHTELHVLCGPLTQAQQGQMVEQVLEALSSGDASRSKAAVHCIETLVKSAPDFIVSAVIDGVVNLLDASALRAFSPEELSQYQQPYEPPAEGSTVGMVSYGQQKLSAADRMYATEDGDWEAELKKDMEKAAAAPVAAVKKPAAKKPVEKKKKVKKGEEEVNFDKPKKKPAKKPTKPVTKISANPASNSTQAAEGAAAENTDAVKQIQCAITRIEAALLAVTAISDANPQVLSLALPNTVMPSMVELLKLYVISPQAHQALATIIQQACSPRTAPLNQLIALCTWRALSPGPYEKGLAEQPLPAMLEHLTQALTGLGGSLGEGGFGASVPVLHHILKSKPSPNHAAALKVLCENVSCHVLPWTPLIEALVHTMKTTADANMSNNAGEALVATASKLPAGLATPLYALLDGLVCNKETVRHATLRALQQLPTAITPDAHSTALLWFACSDSVEQNKQLAGSLWDEYGQQLQEHYLQQLLPLLSEEQEPVRKQAGAAIAAAIEVWPDSEQATLNALIELFVGLIDPLEHTMVAGDICAGESDQEFAMRSNTRHGVACALEGAAALLSSDSVNSLLAFMMKRALGDDQHQVRQQLTTAGIAIVSAHGEAQISTLLPLFEQELSRPATNETEDYIHSSVVLFLGSLSKHLPKDDPKVPEIIQQLVAALSTPSEPVQLAAAGAITPLCPAIKGTQTAADFIAGLKESVIRADSMAERRGASHGMACMVKGLGIISLKQYQIMEHLKVALEDGSNANGRQGALFAYELLCSNLGRLFEPYVMQILPNLLKCYSDVPFVREADNHTAKVVMGNLTAHGVKLVLPHLLDGLEDRQWRTKTAAANFLGSMAHCAPKQLSSCLPQIVPRLGDALSDSHLEVRKAGKIALNQIGAVIRNPEIQSVVPVLLKALEEPSEGTKQAIGALMATSYVHSIDAASLALLIPILLRGLRDRSSEVKRNSVQIIGSMCTLVADKKDLLPYVVELLPEIKQVLVDPIPESRMFAAKALGMLVSGLGQNTFDDLVPWLQEKVESSKSTIERFGAAQGLGEVLGALGADELETRLPHLLLKITERNPHVREGYLGVLLYLVPVFGQQLAPFMQEMLPLVVQGLADDAEPVRDISMQVACRLIEAFCHEAKEMMLPVFFEGLFHRNWRIRMSTVELIGILLAQLTGNPIANLRGEGLVGDDDVTLIGALSESSNEAMIESLGLPMYHNIVAALYIMRSDENTSVGHMAHRVWRTITENTGRMLQQIFPMLIEKVIDFLSDSDIEKQQLAGRSLGELVRKMADRVLPELMPVLLAKLQEDQSESHARHGVCLGLCEVIEHCANGYIEGYLEQFMEAIQVALTDDADHVRHAAAQAFSLLHKTAGERVIEYIVPTLLAFMQDETNSNALYGLREILSVKSSAVLAFVVPNLVEGEIEPAQAAAIASLSEVSGNALHHHLENILEALLEQMHQPESFAVVPHIADAAAAVLRAVQPDSIQLMMFELHNAMGHDDAHVRVAGATLAADWAKNTKIDWSSHRVSLLQHLIPLLGDSEQPVATAAVTSLTAVTSNVKKEALCGLISLLRMELRTLAQLNPGGDIAGFTVPKGIASVLPVYLHGLMHGSPDTIREQAALAIGEMIRSTPESGLKPFVLQITGPLIRIVGDRFPWQVKAAILSTLLALIQKSGKALKPFLPQLQTSFVKLLHDENSTLRIRASAALELSLIHI
eukprot:TRINITY_DN7467_c0_g1_i2.p1 TRINITY_DN7467_c0_g1~~TRINITY_DN7467_c0_g1_i2.p1  ORF type:complete len:2342 (+),score=823.11 TRINITY_DN7467_c0_g1_i2:10-7035(+)